MPDPVPLDYAPAPPSSIWSVIRLTGPRVVWPIVCLAGLAYSSYGCLPRLSSYRPGLADALVFPMLVLGLRGLVAWVIGSRSRWAYVYAAMFVLLPAIGMFIAVLINWPWGVVPNRFLWIKL